MSIVTQVQIILNDSGVFWPLATVLDAINEAQFTVSGEVRFALTSATFTLSSNVDVFTMPAGVLIPKWIEGTNILTSPQSVRRFFPTSMRNVENALRTWKGDNKGQPQYFIVWDATHLRCFPRPDGLGPGPGGVYPFTLYGIGFPSEITTNLQDVSGPSNYVQAVQNLSASLLFESTRPDLADLYMSLAQEQILNFKKRLRNQQSHDIQTLKPATTRFELQQAGILASAPDYYPGKF